MKLLSPAKLNLSLRVRGKRSDGYHEVIYLMHTIGLFDHLEFVPSQRDTLTTNMETDDENLILKAMQLFRKKTGNQAHFSVRLDKRIPLEAGLGGGSGNAATTLWAMNAFTGATVSEETLAMWGHDLGADIPFFFSHGAALCTGRGDSYVEETPREGVVWIAKPPIGLSTSDVYRHAKPNTAPLTLYENDLEEAAFAIQPSLRLLKEDLYALGFRHVCMTGSGSAFFCIGHIENPQLTDIIFYKTQFIHRQQNNWYVQYSRYEEKTFR